MEIEVLTKDDPLTGFERIIRITNEWGFWWFLQVRDYETSIKKAVEIVEDVMTNRQKSKYSWEHHFKAV